MNDYQTYGYFDDLEWRQPLEEPFAPKKIDIPNLMDTENDVKYDAETLDYYYEAQRYNDLVDSWRALRYGATQEQENSWADSGPLGGDGSTWAFEGHAELHEGLTNVEPEPLEIANGMMPTPVSNMDMADFCEDCRTDHLKQEGKRWCTVERDAKVHVMDLDEREENTDDASLQDEELFERLLEHFLSSDSETEFDAEEPQLNEHDVVDEQ